MKTKTLAQLKRDAKSGKLFAKMVLRMGDTDIPERLQGVRQIVDANNVGIFFLNADKKRSELRIEASSLVEYTDNSLILYDAGLRDLTPEEKAILNKWESMRDFKQEETDLLTDGSTTFYRRKRFFIEAGYEYLLGYEKKQGKKLDFNTGKVYDNRVKGDICMKYELVS